MAKPTEPRKQSTAAPLRLSSRPTRRSLTGSPSPRPAPPMRCFERRSRDRERVQAGYPADLRPWQSSATAMPLSSTGSENRRQAASRSFLFNEADLASAGTLYLDATTATRSIGARCDRHQPLGDGERRKSAHVSDRFHIGFQRHGGQHLGALATSRTLDLDLTLTVQHRCGRSRLLRRFHPRRSTPSAAINFICITAIIWAARISRVRV